MIYVNFEVGTALLNKIKVLFTFVCAGVFKPIIRQPAIYPKYFMSWSRRKALCEREIVCLRALVGGWINTRFRVARSSAERVSAVSCFTRQCDVIPLSHTRSKYRLFN
jgi:hypothetical protein